MTKTDSAYTMQVKSLGLLSRINDAVRSYLTYDMFLCHRNLTAQRTSDYTHSLLIERYQLKLINYSVQEQI